MSKEFKRTDWMRSFRLGKAKSRVPWRRARGVHSKIRRKRMGYPRKPSVGYRTEVAVAGLVKGVQPILVHNVQEIEAIAEKNVGVIIARVGAKKKLDMIKKAQEKGLKILNVSKGEKAK
jgi:large subunit ribosomal protein L32e